MIYWHSVKRNYSFDSVVDAQNSWLNTCNDYYNSLGLYGVPKGHDPWSLWDTTYYGGKDIGTASNIVFSNGLLDPWSSVSAQKCERHGSAVIIDLGGHHLDLFFPTDADPESVILARKLKRRRLENG